MTPRGKILEDISDIAESHNLILKDLLNPGRFKHIVKARNEAMWYVHEKYDRSLTQIGNIFNMHHSTVLNGIGSHMAKSGIKDEWADIYHQRKERKRINREMQRA